MRTLITCESEIRVPNSNLAEDVPLRRPPQGQVLPVLNLGLSVTQAFGWEERAVPRSVWEWKRVSDPGHDTLLLPIY